MAFGFLGPMVASHTTDLPSLQKVMTIKPVPLQQRLPSSIPPSSALSSIRYDPLSPLASLSNDEYSYSNTVVVILKL